MLKLLGPLLLPPSTGEEKATDTEVCVNRAAAVVHTLLAEAAKAKDVAARAELAGELLSRERHLLVESYDEASAQDHQRANAIVLSGAQTGVTSAGLG